MGSIKGPILAEDAWFFPSHPPNIRCPSMYIAEFRIQLIKIEFTFSEATVETPNVSVASRQWLNDYFITWPLLSCDTSWRRIGEILWPLSLFRAGWFLWMAMASFTWTPVLLLWMRMVPWRPRSNKKNTHTDQYLNQDSNYHLEYKRSVFCTHLRRVETVMSERSDREEEVKHVKKELTAHGYMKWAFEIPKKREMVRGSLQG